MNNVKETLQQKIKDGEISMIPRWQFILRSILFGSGLLITTLISIYLLSFILFTLHQSGIIYAPLYGWSGLLLLLVSSPWLLITLLVIFLLALYSLVHHYEFSYQKPFVYSLIGVVLVVVAFASMIERSAFHERFGDLVTKRETPALSAMYQSATPDRTKNIYVGTILEIEEDRLQLQLLTGATATVMISRKTKLPRGAALERNTEVTVYGQVVDGEFTAYGIRPVKERMKQRYELIKERRLEQRGENLRTRTEQRQ